jgi:hypothetical protein
MSRCQKAAGYEIFIKAESQTGVQGAAASQQQQQQQQQQQHNQPKKLVVSPGLHAFLERASSGASS